MNQSIVSREQAAEEGLRLFFTGEACTHGHTAARFTANGKCQECVRVRNKAAHESSDATKRKQRYERHKTQISERSKEKRRARGLKKSGYLRKLTDEQRAESRANWKASAAEKLKAYQIAYYKANRETRLAAAKKYRAENPEAVAALARVKEARRRARKRNAEGSHTRQDIEAIYKLQGGKCAECKTKLKAGYHADHIVPLAIGGSNDRRNIQILCASCNMAKGALSPLAWAEINHRLV